MTETTKPKPKPATRRPRTLRPDIPQRAKTRGDIMIEFMQTLKVPDGPDAGKLLVLRDWQINDIKRVYDPEHLHTFSDGTTRMIRTVRQAVDTIGRKNGKTSKTAGLLLGHLVGPEASWNAQLYSAAYEREQAALLYRAAESMVMQDDELSRLCRPTDSSKVLTCAVNNSRYKALSAEARSKHGFNPTFVVFDELGQFHTDRTLFDVLSTSMGAQVESLLYVISTQAADDLAVLSELIDYGRDIQAGRVKDPTVVLIEYSTPADDELMRQGTSIWDEKVWKLANPALGDFRSLDEMRQMASKAKRIPSLELTFRNLYLNQRVHTRAGFITPSVWELGAKTHGIDNLRGRPAVVALDLSAKRDLTAMVVAVFIAETNEYELLTYAFLPKDNIEHAEKIDRARYVDWVRDGHIIATPGVTIDYSYAVKKLQELWDVFDMRALVFDRWRMDVFKRYIQDAGLVIDDDMYIPFGQGFKDMSPAIEAFEELLVAERLAHNGNPLLRYAMANCVVERDAAGNRKLTKAKSYGRIDPAVAAVMAIGGFELKDKTDVADMIGVV
jgi:phage terminase large subunit-like protein